ncbi:LysR family transcriptional regulator [Asanoa sp. WMMD1127]|uniref:LysR family transcriptional regulator n=1 Tax=Asanoa sp. WMMD1127 TaxID=3016107 RepID=UPI002415BE72|nr:LysR family transcriptional regulator [Asanoa sp. WMMD1127]MDG4826289.1 LysR family transcriptional regulator [Asanoa sp. WMMD1127]
MTDVHLRELRYFVAVAERLHFTRAAEALYVSQPALSKQIHALETQLRAPLFERDRRTVRLTAAGEALLPGARAALEAWAAAEADLAAALARQAAELVVGMSTGVGRSLLPAVRARFAAAAPDAELRLRQVPWSDPTGGLGDAATDAAFVWLPLPDDERFAWVTVATEDRLVALAASHPLAGRDTIAFADLRDEPFLALPPSSGPLRDFWLATDQRAGHPVRIAAEVSTSEETAESVAAGLGVVLLAAGNAALLRRPDVALRPVTGLPPAELVLAWRAGDDRPLLHALRTAVRQATGRP